ncbi:SRPBCC family protein [Vibrio proteolyticus]|uniref:2-keto-3-deoxygluconate kinase n=1 Tax=Vibrio proteolyticus NBRC 13287 TaxID=1219065 RepID=U3BPU1_VIBPR|nr:SRPBCC domain-containing protein [Vibrio proteolyticus]GAD68563.1 hypothetical protein VPR01S_17_00120 [Vibrio proteolyticus NBRC 13287]
MLTLTYQIDIDAEPARIWQVLTELELYRKWATAFSPQSQFHGEWREGEHIAFFDPGLGGTRAVIDKIDVDRAIQIHHIAVFNPEHIIDIDSDSARKWIGSSESYEIIRQGDRAVLEVTIVTHPDFITMFNDGWEKALPKIKALSEE